MAITQTTVAQLEQLGFNIFNANIDPTTNALDPTRFTGIKAQDDPTDAQLAALIAEPMMTIDGRTLATGFEYTLNVTNALQLRPKHWYREEDEICSNTLPPASVNYQFYPAPGGAEAGVGSYGYSIGLANCAAICHAWAAIITMWLAGNYPLAVNQPPPVNA